MKSFPWIAFVCSCGLLVAAASVVAQPGTPEARLPVLVGEVTATSAILQGRLLPVSTSSVADARWGRFAVATQPDFSDATHTPWRAADADDDHLVKTRVMGLDPGTRYHYRLEHGADTTQMAVTPTGTFRTLNPQSTAPFTFAVVNGLNYTRHYAGRDDMHRKVWPPYDAPDAALGFPAFDAVLDLRPDAVVFAGDNVYYDYALPGEAVGTDRASMRRYWHALVGQPRFQALAAAAPAYWIKDDHDFRYNDADTTGDRAPGVALGIDLFREQVPVVAPGDPEAVTYRTHRLNKHVQIWLVEGRDYRSPNAMPDGPGKSIWGEEQAAWLRRTLLASDATFKFVIHPTPLVGPDGAGKQDNHTNYQGFRYERDDFFGWLRERGLTEAGAGLAIIAGDRHWQYHSVHPGGVEEFSVGAFVDGNSRYGIAPGDDGSSDPMGLIRQPYLQAPPSGGFLHVRVAEQAGAVEAALSFFDDEGDSLYTHRMGVDPEAQSPVRRLNLVPVWTRVGDDEGQPGQERGTVSVESAEFSPDGDWVVSGSKGRLYRGDEAWAGDESANVRDTEGAVRRGQAVKLWRVQNGVEVWSWPRVEEVEGVAFSRDGRLVAAGGEDGLVEVLRIRGDDGAVLLEPELVARLKHGDSIDGLRFSHDGRLLATGDENTDLYLWRTSDWQRLAVAQNDGTADWMAVNQMDFTSDDRRIVAAISNGEVRIWRVDATETATGDVAAIALVQERTIRHQAGSSVKSVRVSPDDALIAAGASQDAGIRIWRMDGTLVHHIPSPGGTLEAVEWSPGGRYLFAGGTEGKGEGGVGAIRAYDRDRDFALAMVEPTYRQEYLHVSPDGCHLLSSHEDGTLRLWRIEGME